MKGEAQANAMSVCVCNKTKKITHWTLVVCYLSCALMCYFSYALVCYLSCAVLAITGRTSTCRGRVDCTLSIRSLLVLLHTQSGAPLYNHRVRAAKCGGSREVGAGHRGSSRDTKALALLWKPGPLRTRDAVRN